MELETFILEDNECIDLGEAQEAYDNYPRTEETFQGKREEYLAYVEELKSKNPASITRQEEERADTLYEETNRIRQDCLDRKAVLSRKLEELILEIKEIEADLHYHVKSFDDEGIQLAQSLFKEVLELRDNNGLINAIERAYQARESLTGLLVQARDVWLRRHDEKVCSFLNPSEKG